MFDGGTLLHQLQGAKDTYHAAAWSYRGTVVGAVQNVADLLRAIQNDADALNAARDFEHAAKISFDLARQQMQTGNANVAVPAQRAADLSAGGHPGRAGARRPAFRHRRAVSGAGRRLVEPPEPPAEKILDVGTGQAETVSGKDRNEGFLRGLWPFPKGHADN